MCTKKTADIIRFTVLRHGKPSQDPDWPHTMFLPDRVFDGLLDKIDVEPECLREKFGVPFLVVGSYLVRRESPFEDEPLKSVWEALTARV